MFKRDSYIFLFCALAMFSIFGFVFGDSSIAAEKLSTQGKTKRVSKPHKKNKMLIEQGRALFVANQCLDCHRINNGGRQDGIALDGIAKRRSASFVSEHIKDPEAHVEKAAKQFNYDPNLMPQPNLGDDERKAMVVYLMSLPELKKK